MTKKNILIILLTFFICSLQAIVIYKWKNSTVALYTLSTISSIELGELSKKTNQIKMRLLEFVAEKGCPSCTKNKIKDKNLEINSTWSHTIQSLTIISLTSEEKELFLKLKEGKLKLDLFIVKAQENLKEENWEKMGIIIYEEWADVITNFLNPLEKLQEIQYQKNTKIYHETIQSIKYFIIGSTILFICFLASLINLFLKPFPNN